MLMSTLRPLLAAVTLLAVSAADAQPRSVDIPLGNGTVALTLIELKPGTFTMGSPKEEAHRRTNETQHAVTLSKPFWLGRTEVTQAQWQAVTGKPSPAKNQGNEQLPVDNVSWDEATQFCQTLTEQARKAGHIPANARFTLPTEAQWEYACRAGTGTALNNGKNITSTQGRCANLDEVAWYYPRQTNGYGYFTSVGQFRPNAWGLYDMHGNALEWCLDRMTYANMSDATDPKGDLSRTERVLRGGGCGNGYGYARHCRSAYRYTCNPSYRSYSDYFGFRLLVLPAAE